MKRGTGTAAAAVLMALAGCATSQTDPGTGAPATEGPTEPALPRGALVLDFDDVPATGTRVTSVDNGGVRPIDVTARSNGAAAVTSAPGPEGGGRAVRFPAYTGADAVPSAVLVADAGLTDALDPTSRDFRFGATFRIDERSVGSAADDGDNLIQRGDFGNPGQFKIQVDRGVPSCRVLGSEGEAFVEAETEVDPDTWYSVTCARSTSGVSLALRPYGRPDLTRTWEVERPTGTLDLQGAPFAVGGKVTAEGVPTSSADQFNGVVDNVFFEVERRSG